MGIADVSEEQASHWLAVADGSVKTAIVLAAGADDVASAQRLLSDHQDKLRPVLQALEAGNKATNPNGD